MSTQILPQIIVRCLLSTIVLDVLFVAPQYEALLIQYILWLLQTCPCHILYINFLYEFVDGFIFYQKTMVLVVVKWNSTFQIFCYWVLFTRSFQSADRSQMSSVSCFAYYGDFVTFVVAHIQLNFACCNINNYVFFFLHVFNPEIM